VLFAGYQILKGKLPSDEASQSAWWFPWAKLGVGWCSGVTASLVCYPLDTVKRKLMTDPVHKGSVVRCVKAMYTEGGVGAFYRGCAINAINSGPAAAINFAVYDHLGAAFGRAAG